MAGKFTKNRHYLKIAPTKKAKVEILQMEVPAFAFLHFHRSFAQNFYFPIFQRDER